MCSRCSADFCTVCESLKTHKCTKAIAVAQALLADDDQSEASEDDSDLENARMTLEEAHEVEQEAEDQIRFLTQGFATGSDAAMPPEGVVIHKVYKTAHKATEDCEAACGLTVRDLLFDYSIDVADLYGCKLCWRPGCSPWLPLQTESASSDEEGGGCSVDPSFFDAFDPPFSP